MTLYTLRMSESIKASQSENLKSPSPLELAIVEKFGITPEKVPSVDLKYVFVKHENAEDAEILREPLEKADIVLVEWHGGANELAVDFLNEITHGVGVEAAYGYFDTWENDKSFRHAFYKMIEDTNKIVLPLDVPPEHSSYQGIKDNLEEFYILEDKLRGLHPPKFSEAFGEFEDLCRRYATLQASRDDYINTKTIPTILTALEKKPNLLSRDAISIVAWFGAFHTGIYHAAKKDVHTGASRSFDDNPYVFEPDIFGESARYFRFGKVPSEEVMARAFLLYMQRGTFKALLKLDDSNESSEMRRLLSVFSVSDVEKVYNLTFIQRNEIAAKQFIESRLS